MRSPKVSPDRRPTIASGGDATNGPRARVFTRYVRSMDSRGKPPDTASFQHVWQALRGVLARELRRRGLWHLPPPYLGIQGWQRWTDPGNVGSGSQQHAFDALDELTADGYSFIFVDRIISLRAHALAKPNIEGLIFLSVRHFIHELQRRHDPLGARIFLLLHGVVRELIETRSLEIITDEERLRSASILGFPSAPGALEAAGESELRPLVHRWSDHLMPALVTTRGKGHAKLAARLREHVLDLERQGIESFVLGTVIGLLTRDVRRRWAAILDQAVGEKVVEKLEDGQATMVPWVPPDTGFEARRDFRRWVDCTARELAIFSEDEKTSDQLTTLWNILLDRIAEPKPGSALADPPNPASDWKMPSRREMAQLLGIHRDRLSRLYEILGRIVSKCRETKFHPSDSASEPVAPPRDGQKKDFRQLQEQLRQATGQAIAQSTPDLQEVSADVPRAGDVFVIRESTAPIEWLVLETAIGDSDRCLVIPADTNPQVGEDDISVPADVSGGPLTLRCGLALRLPTALLEPQLRSRQLAPVYVERAQDQQRPFPSELLKASAETSDPIYSDWFEDIATAARQLQAAGLKAEVAPSALPPRERQVPFLRPRHLQALAATFAVFTLGLAALVWIQQRQLAWQSEPYIEPPSEEIVLQDDSARGPETWRVSRDTKALLLDLVLESSSPCEPFRLEFLDSKEHILWESSVIELPLTSEIRLILPSRFLNRTPVELRFYGRCGDSWQLLETRPLHIEWQ